MKKFYKADLCELEKIAVDVETFCADADAASIFAINLCIDEIFTNIVKYGYAGKNDGNVEIIFEKIFPKNESAIKIIMRDNAPQFNPLTQVPDPDLTANIDDRKIGGLGVFFLKKNMDELAYERLNNVNQLTMIRKINQ